MIVKGQIVGHKNIGGLKASKRFRGSNLKTFMQCNELANKAGLRDLTVREGITTMSC